MDGPIPPTAWKLLTEDVKFGMLVADCDHDLNLEPLNFRKMITRARAMLCHGHPWSFQYLQDHLAQILALGKN